MEGSVNQPRVDEAIERVQKMIGGPVACPCCRSIEWRPANKVVRFFFATEDDPDPDGEKADLGGIRTLVLVCQGCSFMRVHVMAED